MGASNLFIIGNGFDLAHGMATGYGDFRRWLIENNRFDVLYELQSAYPAKINEDYLLWCEFEKALGEYDLDTVINWSWENLFLTEISLGNQLFNGLIDVQLPDIIDEAFTKWVRSIQIPLRAKYNTLSRDALYLSFNYTDTLERLYQIPEQQVLHIHGRVAKGEKLIVGHNRKIDPAKYWDDDFDMRENNERMQRLTDMNDLCKPVFEIIEKCDSFFKRLGFTKDIIIFGHSLGEIDYPYYRKIKGSVSSEAIWHFNPYSADDIKRIEKFVQTIKITNYICNQI